MVNALRAGIPAEAIMRCGRQELRGDAALCQNSGRTGARERLRDVSTRWRAKSWDTIPDTAFMRNDALFHVSNPVKNALRTTFLAMAKQSHYSLKRVPDPGARPNTVPQNGAMPPAHGRIQSPKTGLCLPLKNLFVEMAIRQRPLPLVIMPMIIVRLGIKQIQRT